MNLFSQNNLKADPEQVKQLKSWVYQILNIDSNIPISISQLACKESGCPPIETVIAIMTQPVQQYKVHKAVNEINAADIGSLH